MTSTLSALERVTSLNPLLATVNLYLQVQYTMSRHSPEFFKKVDH